MKVSLHWLRDFVDVPSDPREVKSTLTNLGLGVESFTREDDDWVLEVEVTTNRPDCLSHYGVARELATAYGKPLAPLRPAVEEIPEPAAAEIEILDPDLCARYCARVIRNVEVRPSPDWLARRLQSLALRPINNVADVTNYVLMEMGHPLHAFDLERMAGRRVIVRRARNGEGLETLDGVTRTLTADNLVIADAGKPAALAGIMGGAGSAISAATQSVLLESAWFDPLSIRRTAKAQGMHTEASHRFERGADIEIAPVALDRAAELIRELAGGEILSGHVDVYPGRRNPERICLRLVEIRRVLGADIPSQQIERILRSLGFVVNAESGMWRVTPPSFRLDVTREVDLIEEVARHFGYDRLPARMLSAPPRVERDWRREKERALSQTLVSLGYREIITSPLVDDDESQRFSEALPVRIANPLSQQVSSLRTSAFPTMIAALQWNLDRDRQDLRFFEFGKTYRVSLDGVAAERRVLALGLTGNRRPTSIYEPARALEFFDIKGDLETLFELFDLGSVVFVKEGGARYDPLMRGRFLQEGAVLAEFGRLGAEMAKGYKLREFVWLAEIDLETLLGLPLKTKAFRAYSKFPAVERDFSLLIPSDVEYGSLAEIVEKLGVPELVEFRPVDLFRGGAIETNHYGLLLRITLQSPTHTLTGDEATAIGQTIVEALARLSIRLRT